MFLVVRSSSAGRVMVAALLSSPRSPARATSYSDPEAAPSGVRDPNDEYLVALARLTGADALVSLDLDLLEAPLDDLTICTPFEFLTRLDAAPSR
jgi:predicted nucleic acid-binding protein